MASLGLEKSIIGNSSLHGVSINDHPWVFNVTGVHREQHSGYQQFGETGVSPWELSAFSGPLQEMRGSANPMNIDLFHV